MPNKCQYLHCSYDATEQREVLIPEVEGRTYITHVCAMHANGIDKGAPMAVYAYGVQTLGGKS